MRLDRGRRTHYGRGASRPTVNPMESVANLVDIMLVFICGLMIAIIMFWNVDLDNLQARQEDAYQDMGQVYQDPATGKIYVIKPSDDSGSDGSGSLAEGESSSSDTAANETGGGN